MAEPKVLNKDATICYCCQNVATQWLEFKSEETYTKMWLCYHHFKGLREALTGYMKDARHTSRS